MLAASSGKRRKPAVGSPWPRIAPPRPLRSDTKTFDAEAECLGITPFPWQHNVALYANALAPDGRYLYPEVADIVSRRNGKSEILVPHICDRLRRGRRIVHTAQDRRLPREVFNRVADHMATKHYGELARKPRFANGQEEVMTTSGGSYRIIAPTRSSARGMTADDLVLDEIREYDDHELISAARPIVLSSTNPQIFYSSNAGDDTSVVLNAIRARADSDPSLAYLEWSAAPDRAPDDRQGWREANPSIGHMPGLEDALEREHRTHLLSGTLSIFETENLCRWVASMDQTYVDLEAWNSLPRDGHSVPRRSWLGVSLDSSGERASAVMAWKNADGTASLSLVAEVRKRSIDVDAFSEELETATRGFGVMEIGYDPWTDWDLARHVRKARVINGQQYAAASVAFVQHVEKERDVRVKDDEGVIAADLRRLARRRSPSGAYYAVRANEQESATAGLAAIRALWLATDGGPKGLARVF